MSRLAGQVSFWIGFIAFALCVAAMVVPQWQTAPGGVRMGIWRQCEAGSCAKSECSILSLALFGHVALL